MYGILSGFIYYIVLQFHRNLYFYILFLDIFSLFSILKQWMQFKQKSHTCEEHGAHLLFDIYWWTQKTTIILKNRSSGPVKNVRILIFAISYFKKKKGKNTWRCQFLHLHTKNLDDMIYGSWDRLKCDRQTDVGNYESFFALTPHPPLKKKHPKIIILKK